MMAKAGDYSAMGRDELIRDCVALKNKLNRLDIEYSRLANNTITFKFWVVTIATIRLVTPMIP